MDRETVIQLAKDAGLEFTNTGTVFIGGDLNLMAFAQLISKAELEEVDAIICERMEQYAESHVRKVKKKRANRDSTTQEKISAAAVFLVLEEIKERRRFRWS